jgi:hypothetical protein
MNGRVYDYNLGRFLSVDPFIQSPGNSQSMNLYSYIINNPLAGTDPSGYSALCMGGSSTTERMACGTLGGVSQDTIQKSMTVDIRVCCINAGGRLSCWRWLEK